MVPLFNTLPHLSKLIMFELLKLTLVISTFEKDPLDKFITPFSQARYAIIITYWLAQYLIIIPFISNKSNETRSS